MITNNPVSTINLIKGRKKDLLDRFVKWALTVGRLIVMITEIIALSTFLYRFSLDRQLIDLHDKISTKQGMIKFLKNNEDQYRDLQGRLAMASTVPSSELKTSQIFGDILNLAPKDFIFTNLILSKESIKIEAKTQSVTSLSNFIKALKNYPKISSVSLDRVENRTSNVIILVTITAMLKN